jgi:hypothetical protein
MPIGRTLGAGAGMLLGREAGGAGMDPGPEPGDELGASGRPSGPERGTGVAPGGAGSDPGEVIPIAVVLPSRAFRSIFVFFALSSAIGSSETGHRAS